MTRASLTVLPKYYSHKRTPPPKKKKTWIHNSTLFVLIHGNKKWSHDISLSPKKIQKKNIQTNK